MNIRKALERDMSALYEIEQKCFLTDRLSKRSIKNMIRHNNHVLLVAEYKGHIAGYLLTFITPRHKLARHYSLAVLPEYRGKSIGSKLLNEAESYASSKQGIKLEIRADNKNAMKLYESLGYHKCGMKRKYYQDGQDAIEMVKMFK